MVSRFRNGLILMPLSLIGIGYFVPQLGAVLCGEAWSDWMTYGFMGVGVFGFGLGAYRACDAMSIQKGKGSLAERWSKWSTRNMPPAKAKD
ncbi:hypothetical protein [Paraburkholderia sp. J8-2]|uniref:hypothetical protein n=1 Tax=Paraburkholderia sp. J8-2 TaxID=2805440 RepID=UPI002AB6F057|nr:hypothetical protein [Paraburkholderia sp. J8-2]